MTGKDKRTRDVWIFVEDELKTAGAETALPRPLLLGLRTAIECGLTCDQIAAMLLIQSSVYKMKDLMTWSTLLDRISGLLKTMEGSFRKAR